MTGVLREEIDVLGDVKDRLEARNRQLERQNQDSINNYKALEKILREERKIHSNTQV